MSLLDPRSELVDDADGWVWLRPRPRSLQRRQTLTWTLLTLCLGAGAAGVAFLDPLPGTLLAGAALVAAIWLVRSATRAVHTRAGACAIGLLLQIGPRVVQVGWDAVGELRAPPAGEGRARLALLTDDGPAYTTRATFDAEVVATWLEQAAAQARSGGRSVALLDGGPEFTIRR